MSLSTSLNLYGLQGHPPETTVQSLIVPLPVSNDLYSKRLANPNPGFHYDTSPHAGFFIFDYSPGEYVLSSIPTNQFWGLDKDDANSIRDWQRGLVTFIQVAD